jgi:transcriptional regulator with XRE-family HTH domain
MTRADAPVGQLRRLRTELRRQRERSELTQKDVADALDWSLSKVIRIEKGPVGISVTDVRALLQHYDVVDRDQVNNLVEMARASKKPAWWHEYRDVYRQQFWTFMGLEESAIRIRQFQSLVVPGLLQTVDYARFILTAASRKPADVVERRIEVRMGRQRLLRPSGPEMFFVIDESVLRRVIGSPDVMRAQLAELVRLAALPSVVLQVMPFRAGFHSGMRNSFSVFEMSDEENDFAMVIEGVYEDTLIEEATDETLEYVAIFKELEKVALTPAESVEFIKRVYNETGGGHVK